MKIKLLAMDVDGTLTDGRIYVGPEGETMKAFATACAESQNSQPETTPSAIVSSRTSSFIHADSKRLRDRPCNRNRLPAAYGRT